MAVMSRRLGWSAVAVIAVVALAAWSTRGDDNAAEVTTAVVERAASLQSLVTASGEIVASQYADIGSNAMGRVVALTVKEGDRVTAGQVLARLDPIQAAAAADGADAALSAIETDTRSAAAQVRSTEAMLEEARSRQRRGGGRAGARAATARRRITARRPSSIASSRWRPRPGPRRRPPPAPSRRTNYRGPRASAAPNRPAPSARASGISCRRPPSPRQSAARSPGWTSSSAKWW